MVFTLTCMPTTRRYRALVTLGLPTSFSPHCELASTKLRSNRLQLNTAKRDILWCSTTCRQGRTICYLLLFVSGRTTCCLRQLCSRPGNSHRQWCHYPYGVGMFCCVTTAPQHQTFSVRLCVHFAGRVVGYATSRLRQCNTRRASCVPAPSPSVSA